MPEIKVTISVENEKWLRARAASGDLGATLDAVLTDARRHAQPAVASPKPSSSQDFARDVAKMPKIDLDKRK